MNCPVCGTNVMNNQYCPNCGSDVSAFARVPQDKIIVNQTPEQQMTAGDDSVTQLIPENYMNSTGDDSVTQLIPENYMSAQGDDTATVMLDPGQVQGTMPNQQPSFAQQPAFNQPATANGYQQGYGQQQMGYQQPAFNQAGYHPNYNQPAGFGAAVKKAPAVSKAFSLASLILMVGLLISCIVLITKPLFYITQSYIGGIATDDEIEEAIIDQDPDDYEDANQSAKIMFGIVIVFVIIAVLNAWSCFARINNNCVKSPVNKAVGAFVLQLLGLIVFVTLKSMLDDVVTDGIYYGAYTAEEAAMFNVYSLVFVLGIVVALVNVVNLVTSTLAKQATR